MLKYFVLLFSFTVIAQKTAIKGIVKQNDQPVAGVFVYVVDGANNIKHFTKTNGKGNFEFDINLSTDFFLQVKGLDFKDFNISLNKVLSFYNIYLDLKPILLQTIEIKKERIVKKTGDTIRYKTKDFVNNNDRMLADVLKNIPGLEIDADGKIKYQGLAISNFYIDGDDILSKNYNIATDNITAEVIEEIQILENDQPIKLLQNKIIPKPAALNVTFKDNFKGKFIHDLAVGLGYPKLLNVAYTNIAIKKRYKSINLLKFNNTGKNYIREFRSTSNQGNGQDVNFQSNLIDVNTIGNPPIQQIRFNDNENAMASLNISFKLTKDWDVKINSFLMRDFIKNNNQSELLFKLPNLNINFTETNNFTEKYNIVNQQFLIRKNTKFVFISNETNLFASISDKNATTFNTQNIDQNLDNKAVELNNNFVVLKTYKDLIFKGTSDFFYGQSNQNLNIIPGVAKILLNNNFDYNNTNQQIDNKLLFLKNEFSILYKSRLSSYNLNVGSLTSLRTNRSQINIDFNQLNNFSNNLNSGFFKNFAELSYEYRTDRLNYLFKVTPSNWQINGLEKTNLYSNKILLNLDKKFKAEHSFGFDYTFDNEPNSAGNIYQKAYLSNYRSLTFKNLDYLIDAANSFRFNIKLQRTIKLLFFNASISKSFITSNYLVNTNFSNILNTTQFEKTDNKSTLINANMFLNKYFFDLKSTLSVKIDYNKSNRMISFNNNLASNAATSHGYTFSFKPTINDLIKFSSEYTYRVNNNKTSAIQTENIVISQKTENSIDVFFKKYFSFKLTSELVSFKTQTNNTNHFLDAYLNYRKQGNKFEYSLAYTNIFNRNSYFVQQNDLNSIFTTNFFLRPSNILLTVIYKF